jgi:hypothetical protein
MDTTLLLPCAGKSSRYPGLRPKWMLTLPEGDIALARAASSLPLQSYRRTVVAVRAEHEQRYGAGALVRRVLAADVEVLVLDRDTSGPADTVAEMIERSDIAGPIAIKDSDSFFDPMPPPSPGFVALVDVRSAPHMSNVGAKSFAVVNDNGLVVEMIEKALVSNYVSVGLYGFPDAARYLNEFRALAQSHRDGEIFVAHVMNRAIALGSIVAPMFVSGFVDLGTLEDWRRHVRLRGSMLVDLDGVVFQNHSRYFAPHWDDDDIPIAENVAALRACQDRGAQLIFMTARPEIYRQKTENTLRSLGFSPHAIVMDCRHGRRFLINDHAVSNPHPAAVAISIERNSSKLADYLSDWS